MGLRDSIVRALGGKAAPPQAAMNAGWRPWYASWGSEAANTRELVNLMETYGGEDDGIVWVFACTSLIASEIASYPYDFKDPKTDKIIRRPPEDLVELLRNPNEEMTYFDFMEYKQTDEELAGNSYWVMDQQNGLGQPFALYRLRPEYTQIAVNDRGKIAGYVYQPPGFHIPIPYDRKEILHFKARPNPLNPYYGMGTVEAIQRELESELAQTDHVIGFYSDGARISGVLTTQTLSETQFQRFKEQFYEEYTGEANAHKILIAEQGTRFDPITEVPGNTGVVDLRRMTKDAILTGFGIPSPILGGILENANHKIEDSNYIFSRRMMPRAHRTSERLTVNLGSLWDVKIHIQETAAEPQSVKITRAGNMLKGGATVNEARAEMDLPKHPEPWADQPVIPQGFAPFGYMTSGGAPSATPIGPGANVNGNNPAPQPSLNGGQADAYLADSKRRVLSALSNYGDRHDAKRKGLRDKRELMLDEVWNYEDEAAIAVNEYGFHADAAEAIAWQIGHRLWLAIETGKHRSYSINQIAWGFPEEKYDGIAEVFDAFDVEEILDTD